MSDTRLKKGFPLGQRKGQSTVEYMLLVTGIILVLIIFLRPQGTFQNNYNAALHKGVDSMKETSERLWSSMAP